MIIKRTNDKRDIEQIVKLGHKLHKQGYVLYEFPKKRGKYSHLYVAKEKDKVLGYAVLFTPREAKEVYGFTKEEEFGMELSGRWLQSGQIGVDPQYFKRGIGKGLIKKIEEDLKRENFDAIYVKIASWNLNSIKFNEKMGFIKEAEKIEETNHKKERVYLYKKNLKDDI